MQSGIVGFAALLNSRVRNGWCCGFGEVFWRIFLWMRKLPVFVAKHDLVGALHFQLQEIDREKFLGSG